ncbi:hypothetical protein VMCG_02092 [Cytospora schulzeri]|uniref:Major facilitator superfamily (MFS) profile domain-containing protein n=1 Tax=Cytospora schulzeri TaxID=448051 RepID=A0A423X2J9_9PEZI|nr:hypothetical protein VMCG_02092 [Valsa malicola]
MSAEKQLAATAGAENDLGCGSDNGASEPSSTFETGEPRKQEQESNVRLVLLFAAMAIAVFCGGLDANLVAPAIPSFTDTLGSADDAGWYATAYLAIWIPAVVCLTLVLQFGGARYAWTSGVLIALYIVTVVLLVWFVVIQIRHRGVDTVPSFLSYVVFQIAASMSMSMSWLGYYTPFMLSGSALGVAGTALLSTLAVSTGSPKWIGFQVLASTGFGMGFNGPNVAAQTVFQDPRDTPTVLTIITTCQDLGGSLGTSIGEAILGDQVRRKLQRVLPGLTTKQISDEGITGLQDLVAPA